MWDSWRKTKGFVFNDVESRQASRYRTWAVAVGLLLLQIEAKVTDFLSALAVKVTLEQKRVGETDGQRDAVANHTAVCPHAARGCKLPAAAAAESRRRVKSGWGGAMGEELGFFLFITERFD